MTETELQAELTLAQDRHAGLLVYVEKHIAELRPAVTGMAEAVLAAAEAAQAHPELHGAMQGLTTAVKTLDAAAVRLAAFSPPD